MAVAIRQDDGSASNFGRESDSRIGDGLAGLIGEHASADVQCLSGGRGWILARRLRSSHQRDCAEDHGGQHYAFHRNSNAQQQVARAFQARVQAAPGGPPDVWSVQDGSRIL